MTIEELKAIISKAVVEIRKQQDIIAKANELINLKQVDTSKIAEKETALDTQVKAAIPKAEAINE
jgi:hypothetical protein